MFRAWSSKSSYVELSVSGFVLDLNYIRTSEIRIIQFYDFKKYQNCISWVITWNVRDDRSTTSSYDVMIRRILYIIHHNCLTVSKCCMTMHVLNMRLEKKDWMYWSVPSPKVSPSPILPSSNSKSSGKSDTCHYLVGLEFWSQYSFYHIRIPSECHEVGFDKGNIMELVP